MGVIDLFFAESMLSSRAVLDNSLSVANLAKTRHSGIIGVKAAVCRRIAHLSSLKDWQKKA
jgi:hypothetical protein